MTGRGPDSAQSQQIRKYARRAGLSARKRRDGAWEIGDASYTTTADAWAAVNPKAGRRCAWEPCSKPIDESRPMFVMYCPRPALCSNSAFNARRAADGRRAEYKSRPEVAARDRAFLSRPINAECWTCSTPIRKRYGAVNEAKNGNRRLTCSTFCRTVSQTGVWVLAEPVENAPFVADPRRCAYRPCGALFQPLHGGHLYCSGPCSDKAQRARELATLPRFVAGRCLHCGEPFVADRMAGSSFQDRYCSTSCGRLVGKKRKRARKRDAYVEDVWAAKIVERDKGICGLCTLPVDLSVGWGTTGSSATIDHVIPLSRGGTHEPANAQLAHYECNSAKRDRFRPEDWLRRLELAALYGQAPPERPAAEPVDDAVPTEGAYTRTCRGCGRSFRTDYPTARWCTQACKWRITSRRKYARRKSAKAVA